jgi:hypothetical protein
MQEAPLCLCTTLSATALRTYSAAGRCGSLYYSAPAGLFEAGWRLTWRTPSAAATCTVSCRRASASLLPLPDHRTACRQTQVCSWGGCFGRNAPSATATGPSSCMPADALKDFVLGAVWAYYTPSLPLRNHRCNMPGGTPGLSVVPTQWTAHAASETPLVWVAAGRFQFFGRCDGCDGWRKCDQ